MRFPDREEEVALHHRVMSSDPVASSDVFAAFMDPLIAIVVRDLQADDDAAWDSAIDAVFGYLNEPSAYDPSRGRLGTFLAQLAKRRAIDRFRSRAAEIRREQEIAASVELRATAPNEEMERRVEAQLTWERLKQVVPDEHDRAALVLMLEGERSTEILAQALGIEGLSDMERKREVKRHRDRLMKAIERLGTKLLQRGDD